jgi:phospholipase C
VPVYDLRTFPQVLDAHGVSWKWYCHDIATLRLADGQYRLGHDNHFAYWPDFLADASNGDLPSVTWIDPLFAVYGGESHDDHPPSTIEAGQILAFKIYAALCNSPLWDKTLFVVTYDEHGGLFDHVAPVTVADDNPDFRTTGVRVPALVVSPWVEKSAVSHLQFDHTTIIKTILQRFCATGGSAPNFTTRADNANHLGHLLTRDTPRPAPQVHYFNHLAITLANRVADHVTADLVTHAVGAVPDLAPKSDLQQGLLRAQEQIICQGHPLGKA